MKFLFAVIAHFLCMAVYSQKTFSVYFDFNKYDLTGASRSALDSFLRAEKENLAGSVFDLNGYCDADGTDNYNDLLSVNRVKTIKNYLLNHGIRPGNIGDTKGHGEKDPLNENKTEEERQLNRRVDISIISSVAVLPGEKKSLKEKIADSATTAGTNIILNNINFIGGQHHPLPESKPMLDELLAAMKTYPKLVIEIQGHICCQQDIVDGIDLETGFHNLSEARAQTISDWLIHMGIDTNRVSYKGYGHSKPIYPYPEKTEEERIQNRRVEIKIISK